MSGYVEELESRLFLSASPAHISPAALIRRERAMAVDRDDQMAEAMRLDAISQTRAISRTLSEPGDVDMFAFSATAAQPLRFTAGHGASRLRLRFFDSKGREFVWGIGRPTPSVTFPRDGTYYVGISHPRNNHYNPKTGARDKTSSAFGRYTLRISPVAQSTTDADSTDPYASPVDRDQGAAPENDPNDQISEASAPRVLYQEQGEIGPSLTDVDLYSVPVRPSEHLVKGHGAIPYSEYTVTLGSEPPAGGGVLLRLFDPQGNVVASATSNDGPSRRTVVLHYLFAQNLAEPYYYLGVSSIANAHYDPITGLGDTEATAEGSYTLYVSFARSHIIFFPPYAPPTVPLDPSCPWC